MSPGRRWPRAAPLIRSAGRRAPALLAVVVALALPAAATAAPRHLTRIGHASIDRSHVFRVVADRRWAAWTTAADVIKVYALGSGRTRTFPEPEHPRSAPCFLVDAAWGRALLDCNGAWLVDLATGARRRVTPFDESTSYANLGRYWLLATFSEGDSSTDGAFYVSLTGPRSVDADPLGVGYVTRTGDEDQRGLPRVRSCTGRHPGILGDFQAPFQLRYTTRHVELVHCRGGQLVRRSRLGVSVSAEDTMGPRLTGFVGGRHLVVVRNAIGRSVLDLTLSSYDPRTGDGVSVGLVGRHAVVGVPDSPRRATVYLSRRL